MKIVEDSDTRLVIEDRPWFFGGMLVVFILTTLWGAFDTFGEGRFGVTLLMIGLAAMLFYVLNRFVALGRLTIDKSADIATWQQLTAVRRIRRDWPLADLRRTVVETHYNKGRTYRVTLLFDNGDAPLPLTPYFTGLGDQEAIKARINAFLGAPDTANE